MNMKKTLLASAVAVALGGASAVQANTAGLTGIWTGSYTFSMFSPGGGPVGVPTSANWEWDFDPATFGSVGKIIIGNTSTFYGSVWTAHDITFIDNGASYGPGGGLNTPANPPAVNMLFDWSINNDIPVTSDWDVTATGNTVGDTAAVAVNFATITPLTTAFPGFHPNFSGTLTKVANHVPVPAAVWLFGSGLIGLVGVARRRRKS